MVTAQTSLRGCDALIRALQHAGVRVIFTLSGNHIMPVFDAAIGSGIRLIHTRHEAAAVHMADAYSRITGSVGVALVTGGPGHANALSALYTARMAEAPLVLLSGHAPNDQLGLGAFQEMQQAQMAAPVTKAAWTCTAASMVAADVAKAIRIARSGRPGPVHLSLPSDVLEHSAAPVELSVNAFDADAMVLRGDRARDLMQRLVDAKRPLILIGPASLTRRARDLCRALERASGVPVVGMESPRGVADPALGAFAAVLADADAIALIGKRLDFTLKFGRAPAFPVQAEVHQIDAEPEEFERTRRAVGDRLQTTAIADAHAALSALAQAADAMPKTPKTPNTLHTPDSKGWLDQVHGAIAYRPAAWDTARSAIPSRLHPVQMLRPLQILLDSHLDSVLICDGGEIGQWAAACLRAPHRVINGVAGSIGSGLPYAVAARCAEPVAPIVAVMGDGTVGFHIAEYETAVRCRLPFVSVIGNDARWNAEYQIQLRDYGAERLIGCELQPSRYDRVAEAFGAHGEWVTEADALASAIERAHASGLPACINVMIEGVAAPTIRR